MQSLTGTQKIHHAAGLYLEGIRDGRIWDALKAHTGDRYTQHSTGVGDGQQGFADFFEPFLKRNPVRNIQLMRAIEDGPYVFLHVFQDLNNGESCWVTGDLFDTDENDRVIEHWDVIQAFAPQNTFGHTMIDGPAEICDLDKTQVNKAVIAEFFETVLIGRQFERMGNFVCDTQFDQHNPNPDDGLDRLTKHRSDGQDWRCWKVHKLIGQGNFVVTLSHKQVGDSHYCTFDMFRLSNGKIVEHWDVQEKILPPEQWNNQGKF